MIWNEKAECMSHEEKEELQLKRLQKTVKIAYEKIPLYKQKFDDAGVKPEDIKTLKDIEKLPFTTKDDLRASYPFGLFAVPYDDIVEIHASSGTTGKPTVSGYTQKDLDIWGEIIARGLGMAGCEKNWIVQNAYGYGLFTGGFGIHHGANKFGAITVPMSAGNTKRQLDNMQDFQSDILTCTPSYAMYLGESLHAAGIPLENINLKAGIFGAEMWTEEMRNKIEETLGIKALNIYGLTEIMGPGVAQECMEQDGIHISDDHFYPEIINPETGEVLGDDQKGELVLTTLTREGMPIIRFRTKDLTSLMSGDCDCGRTTKRMTRITGRSDDMMKIKGVMVFPSQIEKALLSVEGVTPNYQIIVTRPDILDEIEVKVEASKELFSDEIKELEEVEKKIKAAIRSELGIKVNVTICEPESLPRSEGKAVRVIDERNFE
ncbi:phenylacetate--CoA ligase family protein [uncultured Methanobrevibacter sp.]|uniref:phenylacetate--CoA ligase family protein n=1 Tax=uncultured Methanobrevibacter sp. TaxID=253161 RepID=UPI0015BB27A3|nr:phenylacetate--CoA ligase [uncultured Methanobrevibacter sp.]